MLFYIWINFSWLTNTLHTFHEEFSNFTKVATSDSMWHLLILYPNI